MTTGLRVSLRRAVPKIFEEHPLPWWFVYGALDNDRVSIIHDDAGVRIDEPSTYDMHAILWRLYVAMFPDRLRYLPVDHPVWARIPVFCHYPAPWRRIVHEVPTSIRCIYSTYDGAYVIREPRSYDGSKLYTAVWEMYQYINPTGRVIET